METEEAIKIVKNYNAWRRDDEGVYQQPNPTELGKAIDKLIEVAEKFKRFCLCTEPNGHWDSGQTCFCRKCNKLADAG